MTKGELIKFLEPFSDDIKIVKFDNEYNIYENIEPKYEVFDKNFGTNVSILVKLDEKEGFIEL